MSRFLYISLLLFNFILRAQSELPGKKLYESRCVLCHGKSGGRGVFGAKDLRKSHLGDVELFRVIHQGRNRMPSWRDTFSAEEIRLIIRYVKTLRS